MKSSVLFSIGFALALTSGARLAAQPAMARPSSADLSPLPVDSSGPAPVFVHPYTAQAAQRAPVSTTAFKTTATRSRLISRSLLKPVNFALRYEDSTVYAYSGGRGGDLASDELPYDTYTAYHYSANNATFPPDTRGILTYNAANLPTEQITQQWDAPTLSWKNAYRSASTYDAQNRLLTKTSQEWNANTANWKSTSKAIYTYNAAGLMISQLYQDWDANAAAWKNNSVYESIWAGSLQQNFKARTWAANAWKNVYLNEFTYDAADRLLEDKYFSWDANAAAWKPGSLILRTYNGAGEQSSVEVRVWDAVSSALKPVSLTISTYTPGGMLVTELGQTWDNTFWKNSFRFTYSYDGQNRETERIQEDWVTASSNWKLVDGYYTGYTAAGQPGSVVYKEADANNMLQNKRRKELEYNTWNQLIRKDEQVWINTWTAIVPGGSRERYHYEDYEATGIEQPGSLNAEVRIFPNPATDYLRITAHFAQPQAATVIIADAAGRAVQRTEFTPAQSLNDAVSIAALPAGLYSVTLRTAGGQRCQAVSVVK